MNQLILTEQDRSICREDILISEKNLGVEFPSAYADFLLRNNGGRPNRPYFTMTRGALEKRWRLHFFFGIHSDENSLDLVKVNTDIPSAAPQKLLLIASDEGGGFIGLDLRESRNRVVFWNYSMFWGNNVWNEEQLWEVAKDFESFSIDLSDKA